MTIVFIFQIHNDIYIYTLYPNLEIRRKLKSETYN